MRILFILENYYPAIGGVETLFKTLIDKLEEVGVESTIMTTRHHDLAKVEVSGNTKVIRYKFYSRYLFTFLAFFPALIHGRHVDLIHTTSYNAGLPASIAGFLLRKKVVITFHEVWGKLWFKLPFFSKFSTFFHFLFEQLLLKMPFHLFIAVSEFTASRLLKHRIPPEKIRTIYNGIDYNKWKPAEVDKESSNFKFIYYGRLGISKGLDLLLPAFDQLAQQHDHARLILVLPYEPAQQLAFVRKKCDEMPESYRPTLLHELTQENLIGHLCGSNCVVIPSYSEGFGYTAVESMALELSIISSGNGSLQEVVGGNVIEMKKHSVAGLLEAMKKAIKNDWEYREKREFPLTETVKMYVNLYEQILKKNTSSNQ